MTNTVAERGQSREGSITKERTSPIDVALAMIEGFADALRDEGFKVFIQSKLSVNTLTGDNPQYSRNETERSLKSQYKQAVNALAKHLRAVAHNQWTAQKETGQAKQYYLETVRSLWITKFQEMSQSSKKIESALFAEGSTLNYFVLGAISKHLGILYADLYPKIMPENMQTTTVAVSLLAV